MTNPVWNDALEVGKGEAPGVERQGGNHEKCGDLRLLRAFV